MRSWTSCGSLSQLSQFHFGHELAGRGIARHNAEEDIAEDLAYAGGQ
jgi:predicted HTH domain antitoxin